MVRNGGDAKVRPQMVVDGLRSGNSFAASGQLIDRLAFVACIGNPGVHGRTEAAVAALAANAARGNTDLDLAGCATLGEKLVVPKGADVVVAIVVRDPSGANNSPYVFDNPSLSQIGIRQPINQPVLDHVDVIGGEVSGYRQPGSADYAGAWPNTWLATPDIATVPMAARNTSAKLQRSFSSKTWSAVPADGEFKQMTFRLKSVATTQYLRLRGSNLPANTPWETDADGNPLSDRYTNTAPDAAMLRIPCKAAGANVPSTDVVFTGTGIDGCPEHLPVVNGQKMSAFDVAAWADLWFYSNPIFIEVQGGTRVAGLK
jgi:hypothetical protein